MLFGRRGMFGLAVVCSSHSERNSHKVPAFQIPRFEVRVAQSQFLPVALVTCIPFGDAGHGFSGKYAMKKEFRFRHFRRRRGYVLYRLLGDTAKHNETGSECKEEFDRSIHSTCFLPA